MNRRIVYMASLICCLLAFSCSPKVNNNVLAFFFDGVPTADDPAISETVSPSTIDSSEVSSVKKARLKPAIVVHPPYLSKKCNSCHDPNSISELTDSEPDLCYGCHKNISESFDFLHGPIDGGYCTVCHDPHMSYNKTLLVEPGNSVCFICHFQKSIMSKETHSSNEKIGCTTCHHPHGGDDKLFLEPAKR